MSNRKYEGKCDNCFWYSVDAEKWLDFRGSGNKDERIKIIKEKKCKECNNGSNYSREWKCRKCDVFIGGHNYYFHNSLCNNCWDIMISEEIEKRKNRNV